MKGDPSKSKSTSTQCPTCGACTTNDLICGDCGIAILDVRIPIATTLATASPTTIERLAAPLIVVLDASQSMAQRGPLEAIDEIVDVFKRCQEGFHHELLVGVITFAEVARVLVPVAPVSKVRRSPRVTVQGEAYYGAAFSALRSEINAVMDSMRAEGRHVLRPVVFFVTDGQPADDEFDRQVAFTSLTDDGFKANPNIFVLCMDESKVGLLERYTHRKGSVVVPQGDIAQFLEHLVSPLFMQLG